MLGRRPAKERLARTGLRTSGSVFGLTGSAPYPPYAPAEEDEEGLYAGPGVGGLALPPETVLAPVVVVAPDSSGEGAIG